MGEGQAARTLSCAGRSRCRGRWEIAPKRPLGVCNEAVTGRDRPVTTSSANYAGDPSHPDHDVYLLELGRATYAAAGLAGIAFDVLRIHGGLASNDLYDDALGRLERRLKESPPPVDELDEFLSLLEAARLTRNDLIHALPVQHGLYRRTTKNLRYVRKFYTIESLREARTLMERARSKGNKVLYSDGGAAIKLWYETGR